MTIGRHGRTIFYGNKPWVSAVIYNIDNTTLTPGDAIFLQFDTASTHLTAKRALVIQATEYGRFFGTPRENISPGTSGIATVAGMLPMAEFTMAATGVGTWVGFRGNNVGGFRQATPNTAGGTAVGFLLEPAGTNTTVPILSTFKRR